MPKIPDCDRCQLYARSAYLNCAVHPTGVEGEYCPDFQAEPGAEPEELWQPVGASYYNGELIMQPDRGLSQLQQLALLNWHPLFTGRCPQCGRTIPIADPPQIHWDCSVCGWVDDSV